MDKEKLKGVAIHCKTEKEAIQCCNLADKLGLKWLSGNSFAEINNLEYYKGETTYDFYLGAFADIGWSKFDANEIHSAKWFIKNFGNNN